MKKNSSSSSFTSRVATFAAPLTFGLALAFAGCADADVSVNGLAFEGDTANKGESLLVKGKVESLAELTSITFSVRDDKDAPVANTAGITVSSNALSKDKITWDLRSDGDVKVVTTAATPSGTYRLKVDAKTDRKDTSETVTFKVR